MTASRAGERGTALLIVLMFSALLAGLAAVATRSATSGARAAAVFLDAMRADDLGRSVADAVAYQILHAGPAWKRGGAFTIRIAQAQIDVDYRSESARIDVNKAPVALIAALLAAADAEPSLIAAVTDRIAASRAPTAAAAPSVTQAAFTASTSGLPNDFEAAIAKLAPPPRPQAGPQIQSAREVVRDWGLPDGVANKILPALTVASGSAKVDPVLADRLVLSALMVGDEARVDDYIDKRSQGFVDAESALAPLPLETKAFAGFTDVSAVRAVARVAVAHRFQRRYAVVLEPPSFPGEAPRIFEWQPLF